MGMTLMPELDPTSSSFTQIFNSTFSADFDITPLSRPCNPVFDDLFMLSSTCPPAFSVPFNSSRPSAGPSHRQDVV